MSITLNTDFYCADCDEFEPEVEREVKWENADFSPLSIPIKLHNTIITCKHKNRCKAIYDKALEKTKEK